MRPRVHDERRQCPTLSRPRHLGFGEGALVIEEIARIEENALVKLGWDSMSYEL